MKLSVNTNGELFVKAPWNPLFIEELKKLHGKWNPDEKVWTVNSFVREQLNETICKIFGNLSGQTIETVKCSVVSEIKQEQNAIVFLGKVIASAKGRDSKIGFDQDVIYTIKEPISGGSKKHWYSIIPQGSEFILHDVPVDLYQEYISGAGIYAPYHEYITVREKG